MKKTIKIIITLSALLVAAIIFYVMLRSFSWQEVYALIKVLKWTTVVIFIACILSVSFVKAMRFFVILRAGNVRVSFIKTIMVFISSQAFTPLPGGEVGRALLFKNKLHLEMEQVAAPVYLQAVIELWAAAFLTVASVFFIKTSFGIWLGMGLLVLLVVLTTAILIPHKLSDALNFLESKGLKYKWVDKFSQTMAAAGKFVVKENGVWRWQLWAYLIILGVASHGVGVFLIWYIARLQGVAMSLFQSIFAVGIAALIQGILFIIPGGLGVTEGGLIGVLTTYGVRWNKAVAITLLYRALTLPLLLIIALLFLSFLYIPRVFKKQKYV